MTVREHAELREAVVRCCRRLWERGLIAGPDGNVSVRVAPERILVTPTGISKVDVTADALVEMTLDGVITGEGRPSSEVQLHLRAYRARADVHAVVHAHPPTATGFAVAGEELTRPVLPELILQVGSVPLIPYETPGSVALADRCAAAFALHDAVLLANHGAVTLGATLEVAHQRMESVEHVARILLAARALGRVTELTPAEVAALVALRLGASVDRDAELPRRKR